MGRMLYFVVSFFLFLPPLLSLSFFSPFLFCWNGMKLRGLTFEFFLWGAVGGITHSGASRGGFLQCC